MEILIKGLNVKGCHGVLEQEKTCPQRFVVDMSLTVSDERAAWSDELSDTVNYAAVCERITAVIEKESYCLIERLAGRLTEAIFEAFPAVSKIEVTVKKINPPMVGDFSYMAVRLKRKRTDG